MATVMERDAKGKVVIDGQVTVKVPRTMTALSILHNPFSDGEEFCDDYYVYRKGLRLRKWFAHRSQWKHFWPPVLLDLARVERIYHRLGELQELNAQRMDNIIAAIRERPMVNRDGRKVHVAHVRPTHAYEPYEDRTWWEYQVSYSTLFANWSYRMEWIKPPRRPLNESLGRDLYRRDYGAAHTIHKWTSMVADALDEAIKLRIRKTEEVPSRMMDAQYRVTINGRDYWYKGRCFNGAWLVDRVSWPRDQHRHITV